MGFIIQVSICPQVAKDRLMLQFSAGGEWLCLLLVLAVGVAAWGDPEDSAEDDEDSGECYDEYGWRCNSVDREPGDDYSDDGEKGEKEEKEDDDENDPEILLKRV